MREIREREREKVNEQDMVAVSISSGFNECVHPIISPHENGLSTLTHLHMKTADLLITNHGNVIEKKMLGFFIKTQKNVESR